MYETSKLQKEPESLLILESAQEMVIAFDLSGKINYCNQSACTGYGYGKSELLGKNYTLLFPSERKMEFDNLRSSVLFEERVKPMESVRRKKNGGLMKISTVISPIRDSRSHIIGISSMEREILQFSLAENKSQALIETAPDAMVIVNSHGQIILVNAQTENLFGYTRTELLGKEVEALIPERFLSKHKPHRQSFFKAPKTRSMGHGLELFGRKKNGEEFPVEISLSPLETDEGVFVSAAIRDTTESKKAEKKFRDLLESAPDAMIIVDREGLIRLANLQTDKIFGYNRKDLLGQPISLLMPDRFRSGHPSFMREYFKNPKTREMGSGLQLFGITKRGKEFPIEISLSPLDTEDGLLVSAAIRDISEKKKLEMRLINSNAELDRKVKQRTDQLTQQNKELEQFAYIASHDLQEPLRTISSMTQLLARKYKDKLDTEASQYVKYTVEASQRMSDLIKGLLIYSRIGRVKATKIVDCHTLVETILKDLDVLISEKKAIISFEQLPEVLGNPDELRIVFQNLINNALKFSKEGQPPRITILSNVKKDAVEYTVKDNGIGIDPKYFKKIFIIFQRLHTQSEFKGSGIGLSHCKKIVEQHGGKLSVKSKPGLGSSFTFTLLNH